MRSHRYWCVIFCASLSTLCSLTATSSHAQLAPRAPFNHNVWKAVEPGVQSTAQSTAQSNVQSNAQSNVANLNLSDVRQAYFQGPGDFAMPQIPSTGMNGPSPVSQAAFNQFSNPGGAMQATEVQPAAQSQLRDMNSGANANPNVGYPDAPAYRPTSMQQQVMPPSSPNAYGYQQPSLPPTQLRNAPTGAVATQQPGVYPPPQVVSGDPRFVMQAPRQGNYPTVPYRPPFRTVAMQLPQQSPQVLPVQTASVLPNQAQTLPQTTNLPQYQPTVGAHLASYQAMQPGYCAPTIPSNGVPAFVPGAVAPPTLPPNMTPQLYTPDNAGYRPLFSLGQENYNVQIGRGIIGQPTVYVPGQPIRNFMRYLFP